MSQLDLLPPEPPPPPKLTDRQKFALDRITVAYEAGAPLDSEQLGAFLHEYRQDHGGKGHSRIEACSYCSNEGAQMGRRLRALELAQQRRLGGVGEGSAWVPYGAPKTAPDTAGAEFGEFPEGF